MFAVIITFIIMQFSVSFYMPAFRGCFFHLDASTSDNTLWCELQSGLSLNIAHKEVTNSITILIIEPTHIAHINDEVLLLIADNVTAIFHY